MRNVTIKENPNASSVICIAEEVLNDGEGEK